MSYDYNNQGKKIKFRDERFALNGRRCEICGEEASILVIDHNATTGELRGILCMRHNMALGRFRESPDELEAAAKYLRERGSATPDLEKGGFLIPTKRKVGVNKQKRSEKAQIIIDLAGSGKFHNRAQVAKEYASRVHCLDVTARVAVTRVLNQYNRQSPNKPLLQGGVTFRSQQSATTSTKGKTYV